ncbi:MAG: CHAT domain-containing protein [Myxococcales bacterium]|nr:CHAT domain-containing protein [Myxococcales bacterium]
MKLEDDDRVGALEALSMGVLLEELRVNTSASVRSVADTIATYDDLGEVIDRILRAARGGGDGWSGLALATVLSFRSRAIDASARAAALIQRWVGSDWTTGLALRRAVVAAHVARFPRDDLGRKEEELATATELLRTRKAALDAQVLGNAGAALLTRLNGKEVADALEKRLEEHEALVIFVSFNGSAIHLPKRLITSPWSHGFGVAYSAIVVRRSRTALIDLDDDAIALGAANLRQAIEAEADAYGTPDPATQSSRLDPPLRALYDCLWRPIEGCLTGVRRVWIAADGPAALVPFDALIVDDDHLIDRLELLRLVSGRELLPPLEVPSWEQPNDVVVFGAPDFGEPGPVPSADSSPLSVRLANLAPLPGGEREAAIIRKVFPNARLHVGADATEEALLALDSPRILHIATHALAVDDEETSSDSYLDARSDPFYRTVLACAGASKLAFSVPDFTDGLVSAAEFAHIDLVHTPLVVLSGCETGTGELRAGGLVQGFRDAALMAGAQCVVSSLWNVADAPTASLMATFYEALAKGASPAAALRSSMLRLRATDPSPLFWAGFVATGRSWEPVIARDNGG